ncbi:MAG: transposase [Bacteroidales bacterium]|nr:transposase [Bacteroidales bacterium]
MSLSEEEQKALDAEVAKMEEENAKTIEVKPHTRKVRKPIYSNLPVKEIHIYPDGINMDDYTEIGVETSDSLAIKPAEMYIKRIVRHKMVLKNKLQIESPERQAFEIALLPDMPIYKSMASESLLADILINKYIFQLPFYRQIQKYKESGVVLSDATINDWFIAVCSKLLPLYDQLRLEIMSQDHIQVDESTLPVIDNEKHRAVKGSCGQYEMPYEFLYTSITTKVHAAAILPANLSAAIAAPFRPMDTRHTIPLKAHRTKECSAAGPT